MKGAATLIQGYAALDGFGITRIKNHNVATIEIIIKPIFEELNLLFFNLRYIFSIYILLLLFKCLFSLLLKKISSLIKIK